MILIKVRISLISLALMLVAGVVYAQDNLIVSNVTAVQRPFTALVDITYDLATVDNLPATVTLWLSTDGGATYPFPCVAVSGDVGAGILQGLGLHIVWDVSADYPGFNSANCQLRVTADDGVVFEIPSTTIIIPEQDSEVIQGFTPHGAVTLDAASQYAQNIDIGDVIIGENNETAPNGLLRKVTSKTTVGNSVILETSPALLTEAFEMMDLEETHRLRPADIVSSEFRNGAELLAARDANLFNVGLNCVLYDQDGDQSTTDDQISINGEYKFTADLFTTIDISWFVLRKFEVGIETNETLDIGLDANMGWQFANAQEFDLATLHLGAIPLGGVVWLVPTLTVKAHVQGDLTVSFETGITCTQDIRNGFGYANSDYYLVNDSTRNFTFTPPTFEAEFDFETGASVNASCLLYGVAGPYMGAKTGMHFESIFHADPCTTELRFNLEAIHDAAVGVGIDVWILDLDYNREYELYVQPIGEWVFSLGSAGTVIIDVEPESLNAAWSIEGPCNYSESGNGDTTMTDLKPGDYTVTWGTIASWITPPPETLTLGANETVTFNVVYVEDTVSGIAIVDVEPESLNAPWNIEGPGGYVHSDSGDATLTGLLPGEYTVTWGAVAGWIAPPVESQPLEANGTLTFNAVYVENTSPAGFIHILPGTFTMGSPTNEPGRDSDETQHQVTLTHGIYVQTTEVTNQQYMEMAQWAFDHGYVTASSATLNDNLDGSTKVLKALGSGDYEILFSNGVFNCINPTHPVKYVSWYGAVAYCDWLSIQQGLPRAYDHATWQCNGESPYTATGYRLPTEAEWEYTCRASTQTPFNTGNCLDAELEANYSGNHPLPGCPMGPFGSWTVPVGSYPANSFGLFDMHGNLWEWCNDRYADYDGIVIDPVGPVAGYDRVIRGGSWSYNAPSNRSASRSFIYPDYAVYWDRDFGFRPVRSAE